MQCRNRIGLRITAVIIGVLISLPFALNWYWYFYWESDEKAQAGLPAPPACWIPPGVAVDGRAGASVRTWNDVNGNGVRDASELPLDHVIVRITDEGYQYDPNAPPELGSYMDTYVQVTQENGQASPSVFRPGCACYCWKGSSVAAWAPSGYKATTPTMIALSEDNQVVTFGFKKVSP